jgi:hypothetical protein
MKPLPILVRVLRAPGLMAQLAAHDWELLLRQAAAANLVASLASLAIDGQLLARIPDAPRRHLEWAGVLAARHRQAVLFEVRQIRAALARAGVPLILLKGAAYVAAGLPAAAGRLFSDVDILVPKARLPEVESALMLHGWGNTHHDPYDQRYYREWMHELPPLEHVRRRTVIDVHHAILPETAAARPDPALLCAAAVTVDPGAGLSVLAPADMVLHSAVHLFSDGEFHHGLRDLFDIHRLLVHFGATPGFWDTLAPRARALELERPLFYALRYCARLLGTPVPAAVFAHAAPGGPGRLQLALMDQLFGRALLPPHQSCADGFSAAAGTMLYIRGNWLRMPPLLLTRHLLHKALLSPSEQQRA